MDDQKNGKQTKKSYQLPSRTSLIFRIVAGAYIIYLAYMIVSDLQSSETSNYVLFIAFAILFLIGGLFIIATSVRELRLGRYKDGYLDTSDEEDNSSNIESGEGVNSNKRLEFGEDLEQTQYHKTPTDQK